MSKEKPPRDPHSSPENGDSDDRSREDDRQLGETTRIEETTPFLPDDAEQSSDDIAKTVASEIDVTVEMVDQDESLGTLPPQPNSSTNKTVNGSDEVTQVFGSVLDDTDVTRTISPRELSKEESQTWDDSTVRTMEESSPQSSRQSRQDPAVERSFSETKLLIRDRDVAAPKDDPATPSDYRLVRMLGKGGMGNVYVAKQGSLDRLIAVKVIRPLDQKRRQHLEQTGRLEEVERDRRHQFLSEAVVTGDLDHPNIVPIHDIAVTSDNTLFYAMKRVVGTPWSKVIKDKTRDENLDILLKVCDAIGFAHARGIVHRDIKPENIMLGDFGVVMVMDWGLALAQPEFEKIDSIAHSAGLGGTPAFMAPEMATGPIEKIGPPADIYLLGATLFYIVSGKPPHHGDNVSHCLQAVTANEIREVDQHHRGELLQIALKAMATEPQDRYADVREFQAAIRQYRSHAESVVLTTRATADLELAIRNKNYADFSRARFGFEQSLSLWAGNQPAKQGLADTTIAHATAANDNEDFDLGLSLLDEKNGTHQPLIEILLAGRRLRQQRVSRLRLFKRVAAAMLAFILVGGTIAGSVIIAQRNRALKAEEVAVDAEKVAVEAKGLAEQQEKIAIAEKVEAQRQKDFAKKQEKIAIKAKEDTQQALENLKVANAKTQVALVEVTRAEAEAQKERLSAIDAAEKERQQRKIADLQTERAEYETYLSQIGLAKADIERNEFDDARRILENVRTLRESQPGGLAWEWRWLWRQANQSSASKKSPDVLIDLALATSGNAVAENGVAVLANGYLQPFVVRENGDVQHLPMVQLANGAEATAAAISKSNDEVAVGTTRGEIQIWDREFDMLRRTLIGHESRVTSLQFVDDAILVSGSTDKTARLWSTDTSSPLETCWHIAAVRDVAATRLDGEIRLVTAVADRSAGRAVLWSLRDDSMQGTRRGEFLRHDAPVASIALAPDGKSVATGDIAGNLFLWSPSDAVSANYGEVLSSAVEGLSDSAEGKSSRKTLPQTFDRMVDPAIEMEGQQWVSTMPTTVREGRSHDGIVESIRFSQDGDFLITASADYTMKVWDVRHSSLQKTLRGHGGWVTDVAFVGGSHEQIVSVSNDSTIRRWDANSYVGASTRFDQRMTSLVSADSQKSSGDVQAEPHDDEIWSARFDPKGERVVTASRDHSARVLEIDPVTMAFSKITTMQHDDDARLSEGTAFKAMSFALDRDHGRLFVGSADAIIRIWNIERGNEIAQATGTGLNRSFALSRDGSLLLTGSSSTEHDAIVWRIDPDGKDDPIVLWKIKAHEQPVTAFAISGDNRTCFTGDQNGIGYLWDVDTQQRMGTGIEDVREYRINAACFSADSRQLLIAADDEQVTRIDLASRKRVGRLSHDGFVTQLSLSRDGTKAVTVSETTTSKQIRTEARLWDLKTETYQRLHRLETKLGESKDVERITAAHFGDQSRWIVVSVAAAGDKPARVMRWDSSQANRVNTEPSSLRLPRQLSYLQSAMPIGSRKMITLNGDAAFLWDLESMNHIKSYRDHGAVTQAAFSHDGNYVVTASRSVKIWDAATGRSLGKLESPHDGFVRSVDFSPTKLELVTGGDDGIARRWSWDPDDKRFELVREHNPGKNDPSQNRPVRRVRYSPDATSLLVAGMSGTARIWHLSGDASGTFSSYNVSAGGNFTCGAFSSDGQWVVLGSDDKKVRMFPVVAEGPTPTEPITFVGHADRIEDVAILQDASHEMRVFSASRDKSARVWDPRIGSQENAGREVIALRRHTQGVTAVDASVDGNVVMTAGRDGAVVLWPAAAAQSPEN